MVVNLDPFFLGLSGRESDLQRGEVTLGHGLESPGRHCIVVEDMGVSKSRGTPKSSILIGFSLINHPFWGTPILGNTHKLKTVWSLFAYNLQVPPPKV